MQTAVFDSERRAGSDGQSAELVTQSMANLHTAVQPVFTHKRGRNRLSLSWRFKLAVAVSVSALVAVSLLIQA